MSTSVRPAAQGGLAVHPTPAAIAVVIRGDHTVLVQRGNTLHPGRWGFPGGKIETGEAVSVAAVRELREETGVRAEACRNFAAIDVILHDDDGTLRQHFVLVAVLCRWLSGEPAAADDALDARWVRIDDIDTAGLDLVNHHVAHIAREAAQLMHAIDDRHARDQVSKPVTASNNA